VHKAQNNPFKGLRAFRKDDSGTLFGRDRDLALVHDRLFTGKTTLLFAGAGVGKTSFLRAKLIPETDSVRNVFYHGQWATGEPLKTLLQALPTPAKVMAASAGARMAGTANSEQDVPTTLQQYFERAGMQRCILILDQFEEVFQNHVWQDYFEQFLDQLSEIINAHDLQVRVLFSMREEFLGELSVFDNRIPDLFNNYYRLKHPNKTDAAEIIRQTCALAEARVDESGLDQLIADLALAARPTRGASTSGAASNGSHLRSDLVFLPYLQLVCRRLWEEHERSSIGAPFLASYRPGLAARLLKAFCWEKLAALDEEQKKTVAASLEHLVTRHGAKVPCELRNLASLTQESPAEIDAVLTRLAEEDTRVLRITRAADGSKWFELYHDLYAPILNEWKQEFEIQMRSEEQKRSRHLVGQAELFLRATISMLQNEKSGPGRDPIASLSTWARLVERQGDRGGAARLLRRVLAIQEERLGDAHPDVASTLAHLARLIKSPAEAEQMLRRALRILETCIGPEVAEVGLALTDLARLLRRQHRDKEAEPLLRQALAAQEKAFGADNPDVISLFAELTSLLRETGKVDEANALLFRRAVNASEKSPDAELDRWIRRTAADLSMDRKFRRLLAPIDDLLREVASTPAETHRDWYDATILLAVEILDGHIDFARRVDPSSYWRLERDCWLQDVKHAKAYKIWMDRGGGVDQQKEVEDYTKADEQVRSRLFDSAIKATTNEFAPLLDYLNSRYLTGGMLDHNKPETNKLLSFKARRFWEIKKLSDGENWSLAECYCKKFYENVVPAVTSNSPDHVRAVLDALQICGGAKRADIAVNCFEMAIAVYFLDPATIKAVLEEQVTSKL